MHEIPFPKLNLSTIANPVSAIMPTPEFHQTIEFFNQNPASARSLLSTVSQALIFSIVRNGQPEHVVEIGTFKGGTTEVISRALDASGRGLIHTVNPFDSDQFLTFLESWPDNLRSRVRFYPTDSMGFFMQIQSEGIRPWLVFVDGCHDYEFALFDIQCAARWLTPGGFIFIDNVSQVGPYFAALDFMKDNRSWLNCSWQPGTFDPTKAYDLERRAIIGTDFIVLRAPDIHLIGDRPRTFGEVPQPSGRVNGVEIQLSMPNSGTLYIQCVLRGFGDTQEELSSETSCVIETYQTELNIMFKNPLVLLNSCTNCRAEIWLIWTGSTPLTLKDAPRAI